MDDAGNDDDDDEEASTLYVLLVMFVVVITELWKLTDPFDVFRLIPLARAWPFPLAVPFVLRMPLPCFMLILLCPLPLPLPLLSCCCLACSSISLVAILKGWDDSSFYTQSREKKGVRMTMGRGREAREREGFGVLEAGRKEREQKKAEERKREGKEGDEETPFPSRGTDLADKKGLLPFLLRGTQIPVQTFFFRSFIQVRSSSSRPSVVALCFVFSITKGRVHRRVSRLLGSSP